MDLSKASQDEFDDIMQFISVCVAYIRKKGQTYWSDDYPYPDLVREDVLDGNLYLLKERKNKILAIVTMDEKQAPPYENVNWRYTKGNIVVFHRMAIHPEYQEKGLAREFQDMMDEKARNMGYSIIRLDTHFGNDRVIRFLENRGFQKAGIILYGPAPELGDFICFEKRL